MEVRSRVKPVRQGKVLLETHQKKSPFSYRVAGCERRAFPFMEGPLEKRGYAVSKETESLIAKELLQEGESKIQYVNSQAERLTKKVDSLIRADNSKSNVERNFIDAIQARHKEEILNELENMSIERAEAPLGKKDSYKDSPISKIIEDLKKDPSNHVDVLAELKKQKLGDKESYHALRTIKAFYEGLTSTAQEQFRIITKEGAEWGNTELENSLKKDLKESIQEHFARRVPEIKKGIEEALMLDKELVAEKGEPRVPGEEEKLITQFLNTPSWKDKAYQAAGIFAKYLYQTLPTVLPPAQQFNPLNPRWEACAYGPARTRREASERAANQAQTKAENAAYSGYANQEKVEFDAEEYLKEEIPNIPLKPEPNEFLSSQRPLTGTQIQHEKAAWTPQPIGEDFGIPALPQASRNHPLQEPWMSIKDSAEELADATAQTLTSGAQKILKTAKKMATGVQDTAKALKTATQTAISSLTEPETQEEICIEEEPLEPEDPNKYLSESSEEYVMALDMESQEAELFFEEAEDKAPFGPKNLEEETAFLDLSHGPFMQPGAFLGNEKETAEKSAQSPLGIGAFAHPIEDQEGPRNPEADEWIRSLNATTQSPISGSENSQPRFKREGGSLSRDRQVNGWENAGQLFREASARAQANQQRLADLEENEEELISPETSSPSTPLATSTQEAASLISEWQSGITRLRAYSQKTVEVKEQWLWHLETKYQDRVSTFMFQDSRKFLRDIASKTPEALLHLQNNLPRLQKLLSAVEWFENGRFQQQPLETTSPQEETSVTPSLLGPTEQPVANTSVSSPFDLSEPSTQAPHVNIQRLGYHILTQDEHEPILREVVNQLDLLADKDAGPHFNKWLQQLARDLNLTPDHPLFLEVMTAAIPGKIGEELAPVFGYLAPRSQEFLASTTVLLLSLFSQGRAPQYRQAVSQMTLEQAKQSFEGAAEEMLTTPRFNFLSKEFQEVFQKLFETSPVKEAVKPILKKMFSELQDPLFLVSDLGSIGQKQWGSNEHLDASQGIVKAAELELLDDIDTAEEALKFFVEIDTAYGEEVDRGEVSEQDQIDVNLEHLAVEFYSKGEIFEIPQGLTKAAASEFLKTALEKSSYLPPRYRERQKLLDKIVSLERELPTHLSFNDTSKRVLLEANIPPEGIASGTCIWMRYIIWALKPRDHFFQEASVPFTKLKAEEVLTKFLSGAFYDPSFPRNGVSKIAECKINGQVFSLKSLTEKHTQWLADSTQKIEETYAALLPLLIEWRAGKDFKLSTIHFPQARIPKNRHFLDDRYHLPKAHSMILEVSNGNEKKFLHPLFETESGGLLGLAQLPETETDIEAYLQNHIALFFDKTEIAVRNNVEARAMGRVVSPNADLPPSRYESLEFYMEQKKGTQEELASEFAAKNMLVSLLKDQVEDFTKSTHTTPVWRGVIKVLSQIPPFNALPLSCSLLVADFAGVTDPLDRTDEEFVENATGCNMEIFSLGIGGNLKSVTQLSRHLKSLGTKIGRIPSAMRMINQGMPLSSRTPPSSLLKTLLQNKSVRMFERVATAHPWTASLRSGLQNPMTKK